MAILFVVFGHGNHILPAKLGTTISMFVLDGVSIFFVLSGYLIGKILINLLESKEASLKTLGNFWIRRWFRTLPNYFLILTLLGILHLIFSLNFRLEMLPKYFLFSQNLFQEHPWFFPEAWSLSIEEWFYLLVPILLVITIRIFNTSIKSTVPIIAIAIIISVTIFRYCRFLSLNDIASIQWDLLFRKQVATRMDSIMYGVLGAHTSVYWNHVWLKYKNVLLFLGIFLLAVEHFVSLNGLVGMGIYYCVFSFSVVSLGTLSLLPFLSNYKSGSGPVYKSITTISLISYSMYLIHLTLVQGALIRFFPLSEHSGLSGGFLFFFRYILFWLITIIGSLLLYKYYERPMTHLRERMKF